MTVGTRMISGGYLRAIRASLVAGEWCPGPKMDFKSPATAIVNQRFVEVHAPNQNLVGRSLWISPPDGNTLQNRRCRREHHRRRPRDEPCALRLHLQLRRRMAGSRVRRENDGRAGVRGGFAAAGPRTGSEPSHLRLAASPGVLDAALDQPTAGCGDAQSLRRRRRHARRHRSLQPVHADGLGAGARDGRTAGYRRRASATRPARDGRRRPVCSPAESWRASC